MPRRRVLLALAAALAAAALAATPATARTLVVGPGGTHPTLTAAARATGDGDIVRLPPGELFECAVFSARDVVLEGAGPETILSDRTCEGKALLIARGDNLTVRDLVLARARVPDMNGAGIRLEAQGLTLERVRFDNVQVGVLAGQPGPGHIRIADCTFERGGVAGDRPTAALMIGAIALLQVERSTFNDVKGSQVVSAATRTELVENRIGSGIEPGAGPAVQAHAGLLVMRGNVLVIGPNPPPRDAAIVITGDGAELRGNRLENTTGRAQRLLLDWSSGTPLLDGNTVAPGDTLVSSSGSWRRRAGGVAREAWDTGRTLAGGAKRAVLGALGR